MPESQHLKRVACHSVVEDVANSRQRDASHSSQRRPVGSRAQFWLYAQQRERVIQVLKHGIRRGGAVKRPPLGRRDNVLLGLLGNVETKGSGHAE
jgi:hypothetical protein